VHGTAALHEQVFARVPAALMGKAAKARCAPAVQRGKSSLELAESSAPASKRPLAEPVDALAIKEEPASKKPKGKVFTCSRCGASSKDLLGQMTYESYENSLIHVIREPKRGIAYLLFDCFGRYSILRCPTLCRTALRGA
jgi:hypothetical protein